MIRAELAAAHNFTVGLVTITDFSPPCYARVAQHRIGEFNMKSREQHLMLRTCSTERNIVGAEGKSEGGGII